MRPLLKCLRHSGCRPIHVHFFADFSLLLCTPSGNHTWAHLKRKVEHLYRCICVSLLGQAVSLRFLWAALLSRATSVAKMLAFKILCPPRRGAFIYYMLYCPNLWGAFKGMDTFWPVKFPGALKRHIIYCPAFLFARGALKISLCASPWNQILICPARFAGVHLSSYLKTLSLSKNWRKDIYICIYIHIVLVMNGHIIWWVVILGDERLNGLDRRFISGIYIVTCIRCRYL